MLLLKVFGSACVHVAELVNIQSFFVSWYTERGLSASLSPTMLVKSALSSVAPLACLLEKGTGETLKLTVMYIYSLGPTTQ